MPTRFRKIYTPTRLMASRASSTAFLFLVVVVILLSIVRFAAGPTFPFSSHFGLNKDDRTSSGERTNADQHARRKLIPGISSFIGIDCGTDTDYEDDSTGFSYISDKLKYSGTSYPISEKFMSESLWRQLKNVRSFPQKNNGINNCYTLTPSHARGNKFLIRAIFMYGNYDSKNQPPEFGLYVDVNKWEDVKFGDASDVVIKEIIHKPATDYIHVCLVNTGSGTPFISALELIQLDNSIYEAKSGSLVLFGRLDVGAPSKSSERFIRYKDDFYGRLWQPMNFWQQNASSINENIGENVFKVSSTVMSTAGKPDRGRTSEIVLRVHPNQTVYWYMHFVEVENLDKQIDMRKFNIYLNGTIFETVSPSEQTYTAYNRKPVCGDSLKFQFEETLDSTLPPILNAIEVYVVKDFPWPPSAQSDVDAIIGIKKRYGIKKNWQGDPCMPKEFLWDGLGCIYDDRNGAGIISVVNLSSSGLSNDIHSSFSGLSSLQHLDLSNNSLTGRIPEFLANMQSLKSLNLSGNNFEGSIPKSIIERNMSGELTLSIDGNPDLCLSPSCRQEDKTKRPISLVHVLLFLVVLVVAAIVIWKCTRKRREMIAESSQRSSIRPKDGTFTYDEIKTITNNFVKNIGKGRSAEVYLGYLSHDGPKVAVKMVHKEIRYFQNELDHLLRIHHKNLVNLIGYCKEGGHLVLVCEFMSKGNLEKLLSEGSLTWEERLRVAIDAAEGLYYLHTSCKPRIIHRDMKTSNILLNEKLEAKISDFGISKVLATDTQTHTTTVVAGTFGYFDPEYFRTEKLNVKSDVYSFGVVLLELITGQPAVITTNSGEKQHISEWVSSKLKQGDISEIMDSRLHGEFDIPSALKLYEIALRCIPPTAIERKNMAYVLKELKGVKKTLERGKGKMAYRHTEPKLSLGADFDGEMAFHTKTNSFT